MEKYLTFVKLTIKFTSHAFWIDRRAFSRKGSSERFCPKRIKTRSDRTRQRAAISRRGSEAIGGVRFYGNDGWSEIWRFRHGYLVLCISDGRNLESGCFYFGVHVGEQFTGLLGIGKIWNRRAKTKVPRSTRQGGENWGVLFIRAWSGFGCYVAANHSYWSRRLLPIERN